MSYKSIIYSVSRILLVEAALLTFPAIVAIIYGDNTLPSFVVTMGLLVIIGLIGSRIKPQKLSIYAKEGYFIVAFAWILISLFGALPFCLSGSIPSLVDAFFETVSGFTTTGATILREIESHPKSILFWRSFT
ncbi:MAG: TrkH family potassium uptake protein, partial [Clostridia bacterium]|nr:TrkH family potassium uptake protein [Clostridia bacterium]